MASFVSRQKRTKKEKKHDAEQRRIAEELKQEQELIEAQRMREEEAKQKLLAEQLARDEEAKQKLIEMQLLQEKEKQRLITAQRANEAYERNVKKAEELRKLDERPIKQYANCIVLTDDEPEKPNLDELRAERNARWKKMTFFELAEDREFIEHLRIFSIRIDKTGLYFIYGARGIPDPGHGEYTIITEMDDTFDTPRLRLRIVETSTNRITIDKSYSIQTKEQIMEVQDKIVNAHYEYCYSVQAYHGGTSHGRRLCPYSGCKNCTPHRL